MLDYPEPQAKPLVSFHGHNEVEAHINLRRVKPDGTTPEPHHLFKTDLNKSMVSNASSVIPCSESSFVIINEDHIASLIKHNPIRQLGKTLPPIVESTERGELSSESSQNSFTKAQRFHQNLSKNQFDLSEEAKRSKSRKGHSIEEPQEPS